MIAGNLKFNKERLVQAWIEIHRDELMANWELAVNGQEIFKIYPLKLGNIMNPRVKEVVSNNDYTINIVFDNGEEKIFADVYF